MDRAPCVGVSMYTCMSVRMCTHVCNCVYMYVEKRGFLVLDGLIIWIKMQFVLIAFLQCLLPVSYLMLEVSCITVFLYVIVYIAVCVDVYIYMYICVRTPAYTFICMYVPCQGFILMIAFCIFKQLHNFVSRSQFVFNLI